MKGLILAGGAGTRLRPITHTSAKQLVPVANKPILFYGIEAMVEAGITEIGIIVGDTRNEIIRAVGDGSRWGVEVTYLHQEAPEGLAHCVLVAGDFLGEDDFVMYLGDNLLQQGLVHFVDAFEGARRAADEPRLGEEAGAAPAAQILLAEVEDPRQFGVAEIGPDGNVANLVEKPEVPPSNLALVGVYLFDRTIHEAVRAIEKSDRGELEITDAIQWLLDAGHTVRHEVLAGWWLDTGKKDPLLESNRRVLETVGRQVDGEVDAESSIEGNVVVEAGARVVASRIRGPAVIGAGTTVTNSYIGPFSSVAGGCEVTGSELDHSVVLEGARIVDVPRLTDSLIGRDTEVLRCERKPRALRLMLGDHSVVELD